MVNVNLYHASISIAVTEDTTEESSIVDNLEDVTDSDLHIEILMK